MWESQVNALLDARNALAQLAAPLRFGEDLGLLIGPKGQTLQLIHAPAHPQVLDTNTLAALAKKVSEQSSAVPGVQGVECPGIAVAITQHQVLVGGIQFE